MQGIELGHDILQCHRFFFFLCLHEERGHVGREEAEDRDTDEHHEHTNAAAFRCHRISIAIADCCNGGGRPPQCRREVCNRATGVTFEIGGSGGGQYHKAYSHRKDVMQAVLREECARCRDGLGAEACNAQQTEESEPGPQEDVPGQILG